MYNRTNAMFYDIYSAGKLPRTLTPSLAGFAMLAGDLAFSTQLPSLRNGQIIELLPMAITSTK